ncbi:thioredoxin family protein [Aneurinibacillus terranovensis]|uniref:thioredoxin family protein n=1 Tax=Aneurinibacillus terranovensis TaxID=278991 RepID=UPI00041D80DA|nr:thioredoxin family protein [Aneurinibacillus terranovensis]
MNNQVAKIMLFTLSACPTGRSMGTVLKEAKTYLPDLAFETIYTDIEPEITNYYRIKTNPTTLFINLQGHELYRFDGFKETAEVVQTTQRIEQNELQTDTLYEKNQASQEKYTLYLLQGDVLSPVYIEFTNPTSVKAPRITAITLLLKTQKEGYENVFPLNTVLDSLTFEGNTANVYIKLEQDVKEAQKKTMTKALEKTLSYFKIEKVNLHINYNVE